MKMRIWSLVCFLLLIGSAQPARAEVHLWPILELTKEETTVLYPFFAYDEKMLMVFPLYFHLSEEHEHHLLWPLIKFRDGRLTRVVPFWFSENREEFLFLPFISSDSNGTLVLLPPMRIDREGELRAVFPFYMSSSEPVYNKQGQTRETRHILWPLYSKTEIRDQEGNLISRERRWLVFSEGVEEDGSHTRRILGIPLWERSGRKG